MTSLLAALPVILLLAVLGWFAGRVTGRPALVLFERSPVAATIHGGTKRFLRVVEYKPGELQRDALIPFPHAQARAVGFVTRVLDDADGGG